MKTKEEDIEELKALEAEQRTLASRIGVLAERLNKPDEPWNEPDVKKRDEYFFTDGSRVGSSYWQNDRIDKGRWEVGNAFKTREESELATKKSIARAKLQRHMDHVNGYWVADHSIAQNKYGFTTLADGSMGKDFFLTLYSCLPFYYKNESDRDYAFDNFREELELLR